MKKDPYIGSAATKYPYMRWEADVDAAPARAHVEWLMSIGMTQSMISRAAGLSRRPVYNLSLGASTLKAPAAVALLAVTPRPTKHQALVLSYGFRRRAQALSVMGWPTRAIADAIGMEYKNFGQASKGERIQWIVHERFAAKYERMSVVDGGSVRSKSFARQNKFVHPMLWDDVDDWFEQPDVSLLLKHAVVDQVEISADRRDKALELTRAGFSATEIATRLGISARQVVRYRSAA